MPTNVQIAAELLRNAAKFFRQIANENPNLQQQMNANADTYDRVAELVEADPHGFPAKPGGDGAQ